MKTLSLCMIVKDEEKYIEQCIESILPGVSEIIIVDTGSTDSTLEKIKRFKPYIYKFEWNNNFADARNVSLQHAKGEYIIVLDADEVVYAEDLQKLIQAIEITDADCISIRFHNLTNEDDENDFNIHEGLRVFKNGSYHFEGAIHEQPVFNFSDRKPVMEHSEVRIKHYGYLKANGGDKKFERNMKILKEVLVKNPRDSFHLFNMGNQYMSIGDYKTALEYYEKADKYKNITQAYTPHLVVRHASCLRNLKKGDDCLNVIAKGIKTYPECTDLEFLRGLTLTSMKRYTLAIDSFKRCIEMGQAPPNLCFFPDTSNIRPLISIAEIYDIMDDYERSLEYYLKVLKVDGKRYYLIYRIVGILNKMFSDKTIVYKNLCNLFAVSSYKPNVMVMTDALLDERIFGQAKFALEDYVNNGTDVLDSDILFLKGRILFYDKCYKAAFSNFQDAIHPDTAKGVLPNITSRSHEYMTACSLLCEECRERFIETVKSMNDSLEKSVYFAFLTDGKDMMDNKALVIISSILSKLLPIREYYAFENALSILNLVESNKVLLCLARIYFENNFHDMAIKTILRSIKELDALDSNAVMILNKEFIM